MSRKKRVFDNQSLFTPAVVRRYTNSSGILREQTLSSASGSSTVNVEPTGSFRYDPSGSPLKSSQQMPIDFSRFENHTFFASAKVNVNLAYEKIINNFPFDGTRRDYEDWIDDLTGFEKYVLDQYPSYMGYITLHGNDEYVNVIDKAGVLFPSISKKSTAATVMNPLGNSFFVELDLALPSQNSPDQFIFYHASQAGCGYAAYLTDGSSSANSATVNFTVFSGSNHITARTPIDKGNFSHLCFSYNNAAEDKKARIMSGSDVVATTGRFNFNSVNTAGQPMLIGSGSALLSAGLSFTPSQTLSGSINNFRLFHKVRDTSQINRYTKRTLFAEDSDNLRLSLRFNEATGSYQNSDVVLDHSGQSLHSKIANYAASIRSEAPYTSLCSFEGSVFHPTLFPSHPDVISLNENLLASASLYDENNPNMITNLIPKHYLELAKAEDGTSIYGDTFDGVKSTGQKYSVPGSAQIGQPQIISAVLFMWARMFDELKVMIDHVSELVHIDYDKDQSIADQLLPFLSEYYGFELSSMFRNADYDQFFSGENVVSSKTSSLKNLQNEIWRRILINLPEIIRSKGTTHAIKAMFRSSGIDPDRMFRFVEYGSENQLRLGKARKKITEISTLLDFSGSISYIPSETFDAQGFSNKKPRVISSYLTGSRIEVGFPTLSGSMVLKNNKEYFPHGISNSENDGLLTSGSWTIENRFKFPVTRKFTRPQSLFRMHITGSLPAQGVILNVVADPRIDEEADNAKVTLYARPGFSATDPTLSLSIENVNMFDGNKWYVSVGRKRDDDNTQSYVSSSYFLNIARQENGEILEYHTTSSWFLDSNQRGENSLQKKDYLGQRLNASGSFLVFGLQTLDTTLNRHLNASSAPAASRTTNFYGLSGHTRFWSKALTPNEVKEHVRNFTSLGVDDPLKNFGFSHEVTGSFEKLRLDLSTDQPVLHSDASGNLTLVDFSQQFTGSNDLPGLSKAYSFEPSTQIIKPERFDFSAISYLFDEPSVTNKVRIAGLTEGSNIEEYDALPAPIHEIPKASEPIDDVRFAIEFSTAQALNEDIMKIFATLQALDNSIGSPNAMFSEEYHELRQLREIYFNRLNGNVNYTSFFEFFRWLDESFDVMISNLIPKKTNYMGFNMIVEGHVLERSRVPYGSGDIYLGENDRRNLKGSIFLRQLIANVRKI